jgi:coenzyme PQQ precursor peptide PqqA
MTGTIPAVALDVFEAPGRSLPASSRKRGEVRRMAWKTPEFVEVRMDAEVTAYQGDLEE